MRARTADLTPRAEFPGLHVALSPSPILRALCPCGFWRYATGERSALKALGQWEIHAAECGQWRGPKVAATKGQERAARKGQRQRQIAGEALWEGEAA